MLDIDYLRGGLFSIIFLLPLKLRNKYAKNLSLSGYLLKKIKNINIKKDVNGWLIEAQKFKFLVPTLTDDALEIFYPFLDSKNSSVDSFFKKNKFYCEGLYINDFVKILPGDVVLDIGANVGFFSIPASLYCGSSCVVYAFEPIAETTEILKNNISLNQLSNIKVINLALGSFEGNIDFFIDNSDLFESTSSVIVPKNYSDKRSISQTTLDKFVEVENLGRVNFIKVDIEGAERDMLKGAEKTIKRFKPVIAIRTYHLPDDMEVIKEILLSYVPEYKFETYFDKTLYARVDNKE